MNSSLGFNDDCSRFSKILEDRLLEIQEPTTAERNFMILHCDECADCRAFEAAVGQIGVVPPISEDLVNRVTDDYFARSRRFRRLRPATVMPIAASITAIAAALLLMLNLFSSAPPARSEAPLPLQVTSGEPTVNRATVALGTMLEEGQQINSWENPILIESGKKLALALDKKTGLRLERLNKRHVKVNLEKGLLAISLDRTQNIGLTIGVESADVVVTGTVFAVETTSERNAVHVLRGSVRVESRLGDNRSFDVKGGWSFLLDRQQRVPMEQASENEIRSLLHMEVPAEPESEAPQQDRNQPVSEGESVVPDAPTRQQRPKFRSGTKRTTDTPTDTLPETQEEARATVLETETAPSDASLTATDLLRAARDCRKQRNWTCATRTYEKVTRLYPGSPEAATVLLPLAELELDQMNNPARALRHYTRYSDINPSGPLAEEALYGTCKALKALNQKERELNKLKEFLSRYPQSVYVPHAKSRIEVLSDELGIDP